MIRVKRVQKRKKKSGARAFVLFKPIRNGFHPRYKKKEKKEKKKPKEQKWKV